jgi:hypothetical protein
MPFWSGVHLSTPDQMLLRVRKRSRSTRSTVAPVLVANILPGVTGLTPRFPPFSRGFFAKSWARSVLRRVGPCASCAYESVGAWGINEGSEGAGSRVRERERGEGAIVCEGGRGAREGGCEGVGAGCGFEKSGVHQLGVVMGAIMSSGGSTSSGGSCGWGE